MDAPMKRARLVATFAYGTNLDVDSLAQRCPSLRVVGAAALPNHRLVFQAYELGWPGGIPNVMASTGSEVWGLVCEISLEDLEKLDRYEDVPSGYRRTLLPVCFAWGSMHAWVYRLVDPGPDLSPSRDGVEILRRAAARFGFPDSWRTFLDEIRTD